MEFGHEEQCKDLSWQQRTKNQLLVWNWKYRGAGGWLDFIVTPRQHSNIAGCIYCFFTQFYIKMQIEKYCLKVGPQEIAISPGNCQWMTAVNSDFTQGTARCFHLQEVELCGTSDVPMTWQNMPGNGSSALLSPWAFYPEVWRALCSNPQLWENRALL